MTRGTCDLKLLVHKEEHHVHGHVYALCTERLMVLTQENNVNDKLINKVG